MRDVTFSYNGDPVLENVDLMLPEQAAACVVGPNGGGKTTLLKIILGLLTPREGSVQVFGEKPGKVHKRVGYVPQHARHDPMFPVTVRDVVLMGRHGYGLMGWFGRHDREAAQRALEQVDLEGMDERPYADLSGGQRQRVLIARALASEPDLLLLDEPTANVDVRVQERVIEILRGLNKHMAIIMVSHDLGFVSSFVRTVVCVNRRVVTHPTCEITGQVIADIYGADVEMVLHDHAHHAEHPLQHDTFSGDEPSDQSHAEGEEDHAE
jgi:zinc transport system ATP-binding protein